MIRKSVTQKQIAKSEALHTSGLWEENTLPVQVTPSL